MSYLVEFGPFRLDFERRLLLQSGVPLPLPAKALEVLLALVHRRGQLVSKDDLMSAVWPDAFVEEGNLSQSIYVIRRALGDSVEDHRYILTIPGRGYQFVAEVSELTQLEPTPVANPARLPSKEPNLPNWIAAVTSVMRGRNTGWILAIALIAIAFAIGIATCIPPTARYFNNRGVRLQQKGEINEAIREYGRALKLDSNYPEAHYNMADAYEEIPNYDKALEEYQRAMDADPTFYPAYINLSRLYILRLRDYGAALRLVDRALTLNPQQSAVQYSLLKNYAWANLELGQLGQAEQKLNSAIKLNSDRGAAHCLLAKTLDLQERAPEAFKEWEACAAFSNQTDVEPEWRNEAQEKLRKEAAQ